MISAAITPGIQPQKVNINTIKIDPHPLSITAKGGNKIDNNTRHMLIKTKLQLKFGLLVDTILFCYSY